MEQHAGFRLQAEAVVAADDMREVLVAQPFEDAQGIFQRLVGGDRLLLVREVGQHRLDAGKIARAVQTVGQIVAAKDPQGVVEAGLIAFANGQAQQLLHAVAHVAEDFLLGPQGQAQFAERQIDGGGDIPFGFDERAVEIENEQIDFVRGGLSSGLHLSFCRSSFKAVSVAWRVWSFSSASARRTRLSTCFTPTWGGRIGSTIRHRSLMPFT